MKRHCVRSEDERAHILKSGNAITSKHQPFALSPPYGKDVNPNRSTIHKIQIESGSGVSQEFSFCQSDVEMREVDADSCGHISNQLSTRGYRYALKNFSPREIASCFQR